MQRVGLWLFRNHDSRLVCVCQDPGELREHTSGQVLLAADYHTSIQALRERQVIAAEEAVHHPLTREGSGSK